MGSGFMPNARDARERGLASDINREPRLSVVTTDGAGSQVSDGAACMAALAPYPRRPKKSNILFLLLSRLGYKRVSACKVLRKSYAAIATPPNSATVEGAESDSARSRARRRAPPSPLMAWCGYV